MVKYSLHDMLGMNNEFSPRFLEDIQIYLEINKATTNYINDVKWVLQRKNNTNEQNHI